MSKEIKDNKEDAKSKKMETDKLKNVVGGAGNEEQDFILGSGPEDHIYSDIDKGELNKIN